MNRPTNDATQAGPSQSQPIKANKSKAERRQQHYERVQRAGQDDRQLRSDFQLLKEQTDRDGHDLTNLYTTTLSDRLQRANQLSARVRRPREQAVDSEIFASLTDAGMSMAKKLAQGGQGHTAKDFLRRLKELHVTGSQPQARGTGDPEALDWHAIGRLAAHLWRPAVGVCCMVGPLASEAKQRKPVTRHKKAPLAEVVRPDQMQAQDVQETDKQETDRNMEEIYRHLRGNGGAAIPLLELIMNPHPDEAIGFGQTVENLFGLSFLVRDGKVCLFRDPDGRVMVKVSAAKGSQDGEREQFIIAQDFATWQQWKRTVKPSDCLMRHRETAPGRNREADASAAREHRDAPGSSAGPSTPATNATHATKADHGSQNGVGNSGSNGSVRGGGPKQSKRQKGSRLKDNSPQPVIVLSDSSSNDELEASLPQGPIRKKARR